MHYEEALKRWGFAKFREAYPVPDEASWLDDATKDALRPATWEDITVVTNFEEGYACCGGRDPGCYCSFATSPKAEVVVKANKIIVYTMDAEDFDFAKFLGEIVAEAGTVTA